MGVLFDHRGFKRLRMISKNASSCYFFVGNFSTRSQIVGNSGGFGGGIQGGGFSSVKISSSVISNNSALYGGGIGVSGGALTVRNSTLDSNMANEGGGIRNSDGAVTLSYSTLRVQSKITLDINN